MAQVLAVGVAVVDHVFVVDEYPGEDVEMRAAAYSVRCGGNAATTLMVLSQLGHRCALAAVLADAPEATPIERALERHAVDTGPSRRCAGVPPPTSCVLVHPGAGTRTIVHHRSLPEFGCADFERLDPAAYDWLHFEGRNVAELVPMLDRAHARNPRAVRSVEIEKPRPGIEAAYGRADWLLFSRAYARACGQEDPAEFLRTVRPLAPRAHLVCAWGAQGAAGLAPDGRAVRVPAAAVPRAVDTLGAGDVFNAGVIDAGLRGLGLRDTLAWGCRLAGAKCGREGIEGLARACDRP